MLPGTEAAGTVPGGAQTVCTFAHGQGTHPRKAEDELGGCPPEPRDGNPDETMIVIR